jgi:hypothetical protein
MPQQRTTTKKPKTMRRSKTCVHVHRPSARAGPASIFGFLRRLFPSQCMRHTSLHRHPSRHRHPSLHRHKRDLFRLFRMQSSDIAKDGSDRKPVMLPPSLAPGVCHLARRVVSAAVKPREQATRATLCRSPVPDRTVAHQADVHVRQRFAGGRRRRRGPNGHRNPHLQIPSEHPGAAGCSLRRFRRNGEQPVSHRDSAAEGRGRDASPL